MTLTPANCGGIHYQEITLILQKRNYGCNIVGAQISGRNFLLELCGEVRPETAPLQALCCALALHNRAPFEGENRAKRCPDKGTKRGVQQRGQKEKRTSDNRLDECNLVDAQGIPAWQGAQDGT